MAQQLVYTSSPKGLQPGAFGFCVVASTRGIPDRVASFLASTSGYRRVFAPETGKGAMNPVAYTHMLVESGAQTLRILSRVADAGLDYTNRTNKIASFLLLDRAEQPTAGPAAILDDRASLFYATWNQSPKWLEPIALPNLIDAPTALCEEWRRATGSYDWGAALATTVYSGTPVTIVYAPDQNVNSSMRILKLFQESIRLLPPAMRWKATFSTYYMNAPLGSQCQWRAVLAGSQEEANLRANPRALLLDLTRYGASAPIPDTILRDANFANMVRQARGEATAQATPPGFPPVPQRNAAALGAGVPFSASANVPPSANPGSVPPPFADNGGYGVDASGVYPTSGGIEVPKGAKPLNYGRDWQQPGHEERDPFARQSKRQENRSSALKWFLGSAAALAFSASLAIAAMFLIKGDSEILKNISKHFVDIQKDSDPPADVKPLATDNPTEKITGDDATAGNAIGGDVAGGDSTGGDSTGGDSTGGDSTGGDSTGGDSTGGDSTGGDSTGGEATGGDSTGGDATGGDATGGDSTGGDSAGGDATGGEATGGDSTGGDATGGDSTGGDSTGGDSTGGDSTGGDSAGGDSAGGDSTGGDSAGGDADAGDATGVTTNKAKKQDLEALNELREFVKEFNTHYKELLSLNDLEKTSDYKIHDDQEEICVLSDSTSTGASPLKELINRLETHPQLEIVFSIKDNDNSKTSTTFEFSDSNIDSSGNTVSWSLKSSCVWEHEVCYSPMFHMIDITDDKSSERNRPEAMIAVSKNGGVAVVCENDDEGELKKHLQERMDLNVSVYYNKEVVEVGVDVPLARNLESQGNQSDVLEVGYEEKFYTSEYFKVKSRLTRKTYIALTNPRLCQKDGAAVETTKIEIINQSSEGNKIKVRGSSRERTKFEYKIVFPQKQGMTNSGYDQESRLSFTIGCKQDRPQGDDYQIKFKLEEMKFPGPVFEYEDRKELFDNCYLMFDVLYTDEEHIENKKTLGSLKMSTKPSSPQ